MEDRKKVAYFCMEFGLDPELHTYSGGLGILAGDIIKAAKDMNEDVIGIGILWSKGYVEQFNTLNQVINKYYSHNYHFIKNKVGDFALELGNHSVMVDIYRTEEFGNAPLYLLDTNRPDNTREEQMLTSKLYTGSQKEYLLQQALLGKGGLKAQEIVGENPDIIHMNESDSVFAALETFKQNIEKTGDPDTGRKETKKNIRFTTHTPVEAGNPKFGHHLFEETGLRKMYTMIDLHELGGTPFDSTLACLRLAGKTNAVSERHRSKAREMWSDYSGTSEMIGLTNGVHLPSWQSIHVKEAETREEMWGAHMKEKEWLRKSFEADIDINKPLIGFARRFTEYKRPGLFFHDEERARKILEKANIVFAGKAHIEDRQGQELVKKIYQKSLESDSVIWVENYDMNDASRLVKGCDVWLSCPVPPREACSTSTIKAASSGNLNLSIPDGWWWEAGEHGVNGWKFGSEKEKTSEDRDRRDAEDLYRVLENEVIPTYYDDRDKWLEMMENSIETVRKKYTGQRMVEKYRKKMWQ